MVVGLGSRGEGVEPGGLGFVIPQSGPGHRVIEDLDHLGPEAAGELSAPAEGVLPGHPSLLVGGRAEWEVGLAQKAVVRDDAVSGGEHVRQVGPHLRVHGDPPAGS